LTVERKLVGDGLVTFRTEQRSSPNAGFFEGVDSMTRLVTTLAATGIVLWANVAAAQHSDVIQRGEKVYAAQKCQMCHSIAGKGNKNGPLDGVGSKLTPEEIRQWIVDAPGMTAKTKAARKPLMKSYPSLSKEDLDALVAYMASLKKG
jgi:mono/diheme cytochrome c family protein